MDNILAGKMMEGREIFQIGERFFPAAKEGMRAGDCNKVDLLLCPNGKNFSSLPV
ncbi:MAG: hypothetical protein KC592_16830 [Nitrospira sp.]|nr:hypothetical protein [Nitrospira sp.]HNP27924.1 hypothetical protein [Nitrospirales bacterium]